MDSDPNPKRPRLWLEDNSSGDAEPSCSTPLPEHTLTQLDYFGLNDDSIESFISEVESESPSILWLPGELLEMVFAHLSMVHLITSCRLVCKRWNCVISREKFLAWKKLYYKVKSGRHYQSTVIVGKMLLDSGILERENIFSANSSFTSAGSMVASTPSLTLLLLARLLHEQFPHLLVPAKAFKDHCQYACVANIKPELTIESDEDHGIEILSLLVCCSRSVKEVLDAFISLLESKKDTEIATCNYITASEVFYCLATFLYELWNRDMLPLRFHYYVYYALHVVERFSSHRGTLSAIEMNCIPCMPSLASRSVQLTAEQDRVVHLAIQPGRTVKVVALAGTGKTTTLLHLTGYNPYLRFLYCVFNKSVQTHAKMHTFSELTNVTCKTFHSLAYQVTGKHYSKLSGSLSTYWVAWAVSDPPRIPGKRYLASKYIFSRYVMQTVEHFLASADLVLSSCHLPRITLHDIFKDSTVHVDALFITKYRESILKEAQKYWLRMREPNDRRVWMTHDGYLKLFQLSKPSICKNYDVILVDEAQDLTPAIIDILNNQTAMKILVGDPHQQIYSFRGATNAMMHIHADATYFLSQSFRFGPEISYIGHCILSSLKKVRNQTLIGGMQEGSVAGKVSGEEHGQVAVIGRCNSTLFREMVRVCEQCSASGQSMRIGFAGGIDAYNFDSIMDILSLLKEEKKEKSGILKHLKSFQELQTYADNSSDVALQHQIRIVRRYHNDLPTYIQALKRMQCKDLSLADIVFSTAHKSKGLEFDTVKLVDDFCQTFDVTGTAEDPYEQLTEDEYNLLYVAATRAKNNLIVTPTVLDVLKRVGEHFVYPAIPETVDKGESVSFSCAVCCVTKRYESGTFTLVKKLFRNRGSHDQVEHSLVCKMCSFQVAKSFSFAFFHDS